MPPRSCNCSKNFKQKYVEEKIKDLIEGLKILNKNAKSEPQTSYSCLVIEFKHQLTYAKRTVPCISDAVQQVDKLIYTEFIPAITGRIFLPPKLDRLGIPIF